MSRYQEGNVLPSGKPALYVGDKGKIGEPYFSRTLRVVHDDRTRRILDAKLRQFGVRGGGESDPWGPACTRNGTGEPGEGGCASPWCSPASPTLRSPCVCGGVEA